MEASLRTGLVLCLSQASEQQRQASEGEPGRESATGEALLAGQQGEAAGRRRSSSR